MTTVRQTYHWNSDRLSHWESKQSVSGSELLVKADPFGPLVGRHMVQGTTHSRYKGGSQSNYRRFLGHTKFNITIFRNAPFSSLDNDSVTQWHSMTTVRQTYHRNSDRLSHWESKQSVSGSELLVKADPFGPLVGRHMVQGTTHSRYKGGSQSNYRRFLRHTKFNIPIFRNAPFSSLDKGSVTQWHSMTTVSQTYHWNSDRLSHWESKQSVSGSELLVKADPFGPLVGRHMVQGTTHSRYKGGSQSNYRRFLRHTKLNIPIFRNAPFSSLDKDSVTQWHSMTTVRSNISLKQRPAIALGEQAVGVWFRTACESRPFRPPSRPTYGTGHYTQSVQGRVSIKLQKISTSHKIQHPNLQKCSILKPGQRLSHSMTLNDYCWSNISPKQWPAIALGKQAVGVWFRTACESRPFRPPSRPTYGTGHYTQSVQGRVSIKLQKISTSHKIKHPNLQKCSILKPGQRLSHSMTLDDYCSSNISPKQWPAIALGEQAVGVWFRAACESRPFRPPSRPTYGTGHYTQSVQGRVSIKLQKISTSHKIHHPNLQKCSILKPGQRLSHSMTLNDYCWSNISPKQWPAIALGKQAVGVWFRTACESRPFRPPSRPTYGTGHYTQSVQGRVSIKLHKISTSHKIQHPNLQKCSILKPGQRLSHSMTLNDYCWSNISLKQWPAIALGEQAVGVWFRTACESRPFRPPSRPTYGTGHYTQSVQGRVSIKLQKISTSHKIQHPNLQKCSILKPGQRLSHSMTLDDYCSSNISLKQWPAIALGEQAVGVWFRTACESRPFRPPSRPTYGTGHYAQSVQGRVSIKLQKISTSHTIQHPNLHKCSTPFSSLDKGSVTQWHSMTFNDFCSVNIRSASASSAAACYYFCYYYCYCNWFCHCLLLLPVTIIIFFVIVIVAIFVGVMFFLFVLVNVILVSSLSSL